MCPSVLTFIPQIEVIGALNFVNLNFKSYKYKLSLSEPYKKLFNVYTNKKFEIKFSVVT